MTVVVPYHPARVKNGMLTRATLSVTRQTAPARLIAIEDTQRQGAAATRQRGLDQVGTEWTAFLDSDDELDPDHLEHLLACATETGADYVYPWFRVRGGQDPFPQFFGLPWDNRHPHSTTITILVRTDLAKQIGFHGAGEDFRFTQGCVTAGAKIVHLPRRSWTWHHHGKNTSGVAARGDARSR